MTEANRTSLRAAVITVSEKCAAGEREDRSGEVVREMLAGISADVVAKEIVPDERCAIERALRKFVQRVDLIVTTGGTGIAPRDVTPEATRNVIRKELPGFGEAMRAAGIAKTPHAILSRATAGLCAKCLIINLPGSPKGAAECLEAVIQAIPHAIELAHGSGGECGEHRGDINARRKACNS